MSTLDTLFAGLAAYAPRSTAELRAELGPQERLMRRAATVGVALGFLALVAYGVAYALDVRVPALSVLLLVAAVLAIGGSFAGDRAGDIRRELASLSPATPSQVDAVVRAARLEPRLRELLARWLSVTEELRQVEWAKLGPLLAALDVAASGEQLRALLPNLQSGSPNG